MIKVEQITDLSPGVYAITGPCSMSSPCPGDTCPTHGTRQPDEPTGAIDPTVEIAYLKATIADLKAERAETADDIADAYEQGWDDALTPRRCSVTDLDTEDAGCGECGDCIPPNPYRVGGQRMTVGQLGAAHVGQLVRIDGHEHRISGVEHFSDGTSVRCLAGGRFAWRRFASATPCQLLEVAP